MSVSLRITTWTHHDGDKAVLSDSQYASGWDSVEAFMRAAKTRKAPPNGEIHLLPDGYESSRVVNVLGDSFVCYERCTASAAAQQARRKNRSPFAWTTTLSRLIARQGRAGWPG